MNAEHAARGGVAVATSSSFVRPACRRSELQPAAPGARKWLDLAVTACGFMANAHMLVIKVATFVLSW
jgi:hypothetical protein